MGARKEQRKLGAGEAQIIYPKSAMGGGGAIYGAERVLERN
jgi:hypothetical protein